MLIIIQAIDNVQGIEPLNGVFQVHMYFIQLKVINIFFF